MLYLKLFESFKEYTICSDNNYFDFVDDRKNSFLPLTYKEQESIIKLLSGKFEIVKESLNQNDYIDNGAVIGFNKIDNHINCWINTRKVRIMNKTVKYPKGRRANEVSMELTISKLDDEWFLIRDAYSGINAKCDQINGLLKYLKDIL